MDPRARRQAEAKVDMSLDDIIKMQKKRQQRGRMGAAVKVNAAKPQTRGQQNRQQRVRQTRGQWQQQQQGQKQQGQQQQQGQKQRQVMQQQQGQQQQQQQQQRKWQQTATKTARQQQFDQRRGFSQAGGRKKWPQQQTKGQQQTRSGPVRKQQQKQTQPQRNQQGKERQGPVEINRTTAKTAGTKWTNQRRRQQQKPAGGTKNAPVNLTISFTNPNAKTAAQVAHQRAKRQARRNQTQFDHQTGLGAVSVVRPAAPTMAFATPTAEQLPLKITIPVAAIPAVPSEPIVFGQTPVPLSRRFMIGNSF